MDSRRGSRDERYGRVVVVVGGTKVTEVSGDGHTVAKLHHARANKNEEPDKEWFRNNRDTLGRVGPSREASRDGSRDERYGRVVVG
jgi:hypothetical protein